MKRFFLDIAFGLVVLVAVGCMGEFHARKYTHNNWSYKYDYMEHHSGAIKTLLIGNSYFEHGVDPHELGDSTFILAQAGRWLRYDVMLMDRYLRKMPNVQTVLFPVGYSAPYWSNYNHPHTGLTNYYLTNYYTLMNLPYDRFPQCITYSSRVLQGLWTYQEMANFSKIECDDSGFFPLEGQLDNWTEAHNVKPEELDENPVWQQDTAEYRMYITDLARMCNEKHIRFVCIFTPIHDTYLAKTHPEGFRYVDEIMQKVQAQYPTEYYNYAHDPYYNHTDSIWNDCSHLNSVGAAIFARRLKSDLHLE